MHRSAQRREDPAADEWFHPPLSCRGGRLRAQADAMSASVTPSLQLKIIMEFLRRTSIIASYVSDGYRARILNPRRYYYDFPQFRACYIYDAGVTDVIYGDVVPCCSFGSRSSKLGCVAINICNIVGGSTGAGHRVMDINRWLFVAFVVGWGCFLVFLFRRRGF